MTLRRVSIPLVAILASAAFCSVGCYLSRRLPVDAGPIDGAVTRDAGMDAGRDAGTDAGPITCCTDWRFERRVRVEGFGDEQTVTPRLIELEHAPAVVVTGPSDPIGPSGAHLVRFPRDLATQSAPVAVTSGSFTWGQPASSGDRFAVCWGTGGGRNVARLYDSVGAPVSDIITLGEAVATPCTDAAYSGGQFAFVFTARYPGGPVVVPQLLDAATLTVSGALGVGADTDTPATSLIAVDDDFVLAVANRFGAAMDRFNRDELVSSGFSEGRARSVQLVRSSEGLRLLSVVEEEVSPTRTVDTWLMRSFDAMTLTALRGALEVRRFEPPASSPLFDATSDACGTPMLGTSTPSLMRVEPTGLVEFMPDAPSPGTLVGDTSVLVLGTDAYVAFSANSPSLNPQVHVDHYVCNVE